ncbi:MAG: hypothetical protein HY721_25775 [Planctomycetes bacterium]|nr:hypothetical protein [Planctomycetota bacterium]
MVLFLWFSHWAIGPLLKTDWALPVRRARLFDAVWLATVLLGQALVLPALAVLGWGWRAEPGDAAVRLFNLWSLTVLFQTAAALSLPWRKPTFDLAALLLVFVFMGALGYSVYAVAVSRPSALHGVAFLVGSFLLHRLARRLYARFEPSVGALRRPEARLEARPDARQLAERTPEPSSPMDLVPAWPPGHEVSSPVDLLPPRARFLARVLYLKGSYLWACTGCFCFTAFIGMLFLDEPRLAWASNLAGIMLFGGWIPEAVRPELSSLRVLGPVRLYRAVVLPPLALVGLAVLLAARAAGSHLEDPTAWKVYIVVFLLALLAQPLGTALVLPSPSEHRWPRARLVRTPLRALPIALLVAPALLELLGWEPFATAWPALAASTPAFLADQFWLLAPAIVLAGVLLYLRNQRAFRHLEWSPPAVSPS